MLLFKWSNLICIMREICLQYTKKFSCNFLRKYISKSLLSIFLIPWKYSMEWVEKLSYVFDRLTKSFWKSKPSNFLYAATCSCVSERRKWLTRNVKIIYKSPHRHLCARWRIRTYLCTPVPYIYRDLIHTSIILAAKA